MKNFGFFRFLARRRQAVAPKPLEEPRCPFPGCGVVFVPEKDKPLVCPEHRKFILDVLFTMNHFVLRTPPPPQQGQPAKPQGPKIIVPGGPIMPPEMRKAK